MTKNELDTIVMKIKNIILDDNDSHYAGFDLHSSPGHEFHNCFILNNQSVYSSNISVEVESLNDAVDIIKQVTKQDKNEIVQQLDDNGSYYTKDRSLFLHYLKLIKECDEG